MSAEAVKTEDEWADHAKRIVRTEMVRRGFCQGSRHRSLV